MKKKNEPLSEFEKLLLCFSCRYAIGRSSIASQCLPYDIIKHFYHRMTDIDRIRLGEDISREVELSKSFRLPKFLSDEYEVWEKFALALNSKKHYNVVAVDYSIHRCFSYNDEFYPLDKYLSNPYVKCWISEFKSYSSVVE